MDFDLSEEQRLLKESVDGLLNDSYDYDARKKYMKEKGGWSKAVWGKLAEQGLLGLPFAEADGGFGAGAVETMIVMEALGKALVLEPYLATVVIGGGFLRHGGSWSLIGYGFWAVEEKATGRFIGECGFHDLKRDIKPSIEGICGGAGSVSIILRAVVSDSR